MTDSERMHAALALRLFGPLELLLHGTSLPRLRTRKGHWLLALLVLRQGSEVERSWLAGLLWPESSESEASASLRVSLTHLRRALGPEAVRLRSPTLHTLCFDLEGVEVDVLAFDAAIARGDEPSLAQAIALYRGPLLEGCTEEWAFQERQPREQAYLQALETLAAGALTRSDPAAATGYLGRATAVDPLRESAHRGLMQALAASGNYAASLLTYRELRLRLHRELNAEPDPETQALFQEIRSEARGKSGGRTGRRGDGATDKGEPVLDGIGRPVVASPRPPIAPSLPAGTVTFLLTDIKGSTKLWLDDPAAMRQALARHDALAAAVIEQHDGLLVKQRGEGDSLFAVFPRATDAVAAALNLQRALAGEMGVQVFRSGTRAAGGYPRSGWSVQAGKVQDDPALAGPEHLNTRRPEPLPLRVRIALHTGEAERREGDYYGLAVNHCARLRAVGHGGQTLLSQTTAALVRDDLPAGASLRELGAHRLKDLQRAEPLFQLLHPDLPGEFPPLRSLEAFAHNLPVQLTSFIGREQEISEVKRLLESTHLLTLTGAGGCGKTRLALQVAAELVEEYPDGIWLVELAALSDPGLVPQTVAAALGVREAPGRSLTEALADALRSRSLLLVLDNCEHLLPACAELADRLLRACPHFRILATSREGLRLSGEQTYRVPPLSLPDRGPLPPLERMQEYAAVGLFVDRAISSQPAFALTSTNASAVVQVCQQLDGIPLAIELAAARVKALPIEKLNERLDGMFRLLTGGSRTALPRQQTLRALIDWSYNLLSEPERLLLRRLSVFASGWSLEAAEAVCSEEGCRVWGVGCRVDNDSPSLHPTPHTLHPDDVLDLLTSLVEKSLVGYEEPSTHPECPVPKQWVDGEARYRLLETIRQYARERLRESGEGDGVRGRHRDWFVALAEQADPELEGAHQQEWLERLEREHDNLRVALEHGLESEPASALRLAAALGWFWQLRGHWAEGWEALERALERAQRGTSAGGAPGEVRWKALDWAGDLASRRGEHERGKELMEACLALSRELGDQRGIARSLNMLGYVARDRGDDRLARTLWEENLPIWRELGDQLRLTYSLAALGDLAMNQGDYATARALFAEARAINRAIGNPNYVAGNTLGLGWVSLHQGDQEAARTAFEESLAIFRELGIKQGIVDSLGGLAHEAGERGDYGAARSLIEESLAIQRELGNKGAIVNSLRSLGGVAIDQGDYAASRALLEEARTLGLEVGDSSLQSHVCMDQGHLLLALGDYPAARSRFEEGLALRRAAGRMVWVAWALLEVGHAAWFQGDHGVTRSHALEALALFQEPEDKEGLLSALESLAVAALAQGRKQHAARLMGAVEALRRGLQLPGPWWWRRPRERMGEAVRAASLERAFAAAVAEGRAMTIDQVVADALEQNHRVG